MTSHDEMSSIDRTTLRAWRFGNIVGWGLGALIVAIAMNFAASILIDDVLDAAIDPITGGAVVPAEIAVLVTALLVGTAVGGVVGSRVVGAPIVVTVAVMIVYLGLWPMAILIAGTSGLWLAIGVAAHFAFAVLTARFMSRRKVRH